MRLLKGGCGGGGGRAALTPGPSPARRGGSRPLVKGLFAQRVDNGQADWRAARCRLWRIGLGPQRASGGKERDKARQWLKTALMWIVRWAATGVNAYICWPTFVTPRRCKRG